MLRTFPRVLSQRWVLSASSGLPHRNASTANPSARDDEAELEAARKWLASFHRETIPKDIFEIKFSRSSGPGGQNVNKVNSKATLRVPTGDLLPLLPRMFHEQLLSSRYHAAKSSAIILQADSSRKQIDNVQECFRKLHHMIMDIGKGILPGETSMGQKRRVKGLQAAETETRLKRKMSRGNLKSERKGGGRADF